MPKKLEKTQSIIVAGVGGQGAITLARLILSAAWRCGFFCLQSEVHGMSQRGGAVNAQVLFDSEPVSSPTAMEGSTDVLIGMEPLETLRYLHMVKWDGVVVCALAPVRNMADYPQEERVLAALERVPGLLQVDTEAHAKRLGSKHAGSMALLGAASDHLPIEADAWQSVIEESFRTKGEKVVRTNVEAFESGRNRSHNE